MKNRIISYSKLSADVRRAFSKWLEMNETNLISFPWKGKHTKGYIFNHDQDQYLVVMPINFSVDDYIDQGPTDFEDLDLDNIKTEA